ncbi:MAG TPA: hypothetical protein VII06_42820 [Chloroflexota bacterium]|jgi:hypothetical protein
MAESLTAHELAVAAGIDPVTAARYCVRFAEHLIPADPPDPDRWAPISVALLQIIHELDQAGYSETEIDAKLREDGAEPPPTDAAPPPATQPADATKPPDAEITIEERVETLRGEIKARPLPPVEPPKADRWWRRFGRRG